MDNYIELPSMMSAWQANTHYKVTGELPVVRGTAPKGVSIHIMNGGKLVFTRQSGNIVFGDECLIAVQEGTMEVNVGSGMFIMGSKCCIKAGYSGSVSFTSDVSETVCRKYSFGKNCDLDFRMGKLSVNTNEMELGNGSILRLCSRKVEGNGTISGNSAVLEAPIRRVFTDGIVVTGDWKIDRSYPQWFADSTTGDWSAAINAAIKMKQCGEVFLPAGEYRVKNSIFVSYGITLAGEKAAGGEKEQENSDGTIDIKNTILMPVVGGSFTNNYVILVNADKKEGDKPSWKKEYPTHYTAVKDLSMRAVKDSAAATSDGQSDGSGTGNNGNPRGIYVAGGATIDNVRWKYLSQGVAFDPDCYSDQKQVVNCKFDYPEYGNGENPAAYDLSGLGDALVFTGNSGCSKGVVLKLSRCGGGIIDSNVLNGTVVIRKSKGLRFSSNHVGAGWLYSDAKNQATGLEIEESTVTVMDNFFEKGSTPSIGIKGDPSNGSNSVVTLQNNSFLFYDTIRYVKNGVPESVSKMHERIKGTSEEDVVIDKYSVVSMKNNFKHWVGNYGIGSGSIYGLCLGLQPPVGSMKSFTEFNTNSHVYSVECSISGGSVVSPSKPTASFSGSVYNLQANPNNLWLDGEDTELEYVYSYAVLNGNNVGAKVQVGVKRTTAIVDGSGLSSSYTGRLKGMLMTVAGISGTGNMTRIRLYREKRKVGTVLCYGKKYVDIPVVGTNVLYDNGISIAGGYKWKDDA